MKRKLCLFYCAVLLLVFRGSVNAQIQVISTYAGNSAVAAGYSGNGGAATAALMNNPASVCTDASGNLYIAEFGNHVVRKVATNGTISLIAGTGVAGNTGNGGAATLAQLSSPNGIAVDGAGNIYIADAAANVVRMVNTSGIISAVAGTGAAAYTGDGGPATAAAIQTPYGLVLDAAGNLYIADYGNHAVRRINTSGVISTFVGNGSGIGSYTGDGGPATTAQVNGPTDVAVDGSGNLYVADNGNHVVRRVTAGNISTFAGNGASGNTGNGGAATAATMITPYGLSTDAAGNVYIVDQANNVVRKVNTSGIISTYAGSGAFGSTGDRGPATNATLAAPTDIVIDNVSGRSFIADFNANAIRMLQPDNVPVFTGGSPQALVICQDAPVTSINTLLSITDADLLQSETWSVNAAPLHGTLGGFPYSTVSAPGTMTPTGLTYTPTALYNGQDSFKINVSDGIATVTKTIFVTVNPTPTVTDPADLAVCNGDIVGPITFTGAVAGTTFSWVNDDTNMGLAASGTGNIASFSAMNTTSTISVATITVTPTANGCTGASQTFTITTNPTPSVIPPSDQTLCNGSPTAAVAFTGAISGTTYSWVNDNTTVGLAASGTGDIASFTALNASPDIDTAIVTITPSANGCTGISNFFRIIVNPTPDVIAPLNMAVCNGETVGPITFAGAVAGTDYNWNNDNSSIGLAASGNGSIGSFTATNATANPKIANISITPSANGCTGTTQNFTVTVNPTPNVITPSNQVVCNGAPTAIVVLTGAVSGTVYNWTNDNILIGLASSGAGNIGTFTGTNVSGTPSTGTILITPTANGCNGIVKAFTITVNPTPDVVTPGTQTFCNGTTTSPILFFGAVSGTTYSWTNDNTGTGLAASGTGSIGSFTATNTTTTPDTGYVTVTPSANGCGGPAQVFAIVINPTPTVNVPFDQTVCEGAATAPVVFAGTVAGTSYSWTNNNTTIGLAASGLGDIASFTGINTSAINQVATVLVTPSAGGCAGPAQSFQITVAPIPGLNTAADAGTICNNTLFTYVPGSATPGVTYAWSRAAVANISNLAASGTDTVREVLINTTNVPVPVAYVYTLTTSGCPNVQTVTLTVNPTPALSSTLTAAPICNNQPFTYTPTSDEAGATFSWIRPFVPGIALAAAAGTGNVNETLINSTNFNLTVTYVYTVTAYGCSNTQNVTVIVHPSPSLSSAAFDTTCSGAVFNYEPTSFTPGTTFAWTRAAVANITPATASGTGNISETLNNSLSTGVTTTYTFTLTANGCSSTHSIAVRVNPVAPMPVISTTSPSSVCSNTMNVNFGAAIAPPTGVTYHWSADNADIYATGNNKQYSLVNFMTPGTAVVTLTSSVLNSGCTSSASYTVNVGTGVADAPADVIFYNNSFICLQNNETGYQWGYDDKLTLDSTLLAGETNQNYMHTGIDTASKFYWVMVSNNGCTQKSYFNMPISTPPKPNTTTVSVYPNPASQRINVDINTTLTGNIQVEVLNTLGQSMQLTTVTDNKAELNIADLVPGIYLINCYRDGARISTTTRFFKN